jgi:predicted nucleic acid-binding protein
MVNPQSRQPVNWWRAANAFLGRTASPKLRMDAYLAAFAIIGGHPLITTDQAFTQFPKLNAVVLSK